ncbi:hypothetical protein CLV47_10580 [Antricoccus suffuscus]|uniref:PspA domain-containing protein n=1 Tax=Antricoccus suffuscus TaxID=1629062 RepID=A0A2T1A299_9ACTN|nr:hypothetical protein [Antricoccus suffuscus]PRZ42458.1 hypothetical protein CLV47_10580 [Antricoccus suffuscus]
MSNSNDPGSADPTPADSSPADSSPADPAPADPKPADSRATDPSAINPAAVIPAPADSDFDLPKSPLPDGYYDERGVPGFDAVRERIEQITAQADGQEVLDEESDKGIDYAQEREKLNKAGKDRLEQIRKSMGL